ncbi:MAG: ComEC/Rec2 family competence protein [Clostridia bacterium]|nr:ComEC/Rec2 family competence protein [Clostridia bacterium]
MKYTFFSFIKKHEVFLFLIFILIFLSRIFFMRYTFNSKYVSSKSASTFYVFVENMYKVDENKVSYLVKLKYKSKYKDSFILSIYKDKYSKENISLEEYINYRYGDVLKLSGKIVIPQNLNNEYEFDYKKYLNSNNIYGLITTYKVDKVENIVANPLIKSIFLFKQSIAIRIDEKLPDKEAELFKSMLYGDDVRLDENIKEDFTSIGVLHIVAVSGSNVSSLLLIVYYILNNFRLKSKTIHIISLIFVIFFCIFANNEISIVRASLAIVITTLSEIFNKSISKYKVIFYTSLAILLYNPYSIFNISFLLSYSAIIGITVFYKVIYSLFNRLIAGITKVNILYALNNSNKSIKLKVMYSILNYINLLFSISLSSQIFVLPIQIYYFNTFQFASIISNILVVSIASLIQITGFIAIFLIYVPFISDIFLNFEYALLRLIISMSEIISRSNMPVLNLPSPNILTIVLYYFYIFLKLLKFRLEKKLKSYKFRFVLKRKNILILSKIQIKRLLLILKICIVVCIIYFYIYTINFEKYIYYFNVGQGNMALIHYNKLNIIIDIGSTTENVASGVLRSFLKAKGINRIDTILITHFHADHSNGYNKISNEFKISNNIYSVPKVKNVELFEQIKKINEEKNISSVEVNRYDNISLGNGIEMIILSPPNSHPIYSSDVLNSNSISLILSIKDKNFLFMGDCTKETEKDMFDDLNKRDNINKDKIMEILKNIKIIQIGHHGSKTSTSEYLLKNVSAKEAVISSSKKVYGHPDETTVKILQKYGLNIKITEKEGGIKIKL